MIDQLVAVDGIQFNGLRFDKVDKTEAEKQARKLAFENAKKKATDYAVLSERTLGKVLTIVDNAGSSAPPNVVAYSPPPPRSHRDFREVPAR